MPIKKFFAVTHTSVYHIKEKGDDGNPSVVKIALRGESPIPVGHKLKNTVMVSVGKNLIGYIPEKYGLMHQLAGFERDISKVNTVFWGGHTSFVVALFEKKADAMACLNEPNLRPADPRFIKSTRNILEKIGDEHPVFFVPHDDLALIH